MTDSPRLEEVFAAVLAEHRGIPCECGFTRPDLMVLDGPDLRSAFEAHVAERLAARFDQFYVRRDSEVRLGFGDEPPSPEKWAPVFRLVGGGQ